jgi:hypothetical protein
MKNPVLSGSFFAFMAMVLIAVCAALFLITPPETSHAASSGDIQAMDSGYDYVEPADAPPVVDAHLEPDTDSI